MTDESPAPASPTAPDTAATPPGASDKPAAPAKPAAAPKAPAPKKKKGEGPPTLPDKIHTWPHLVKREFIASIAVMLLLTVWSVAIDAPLEEPSNPTQTPNPSKAPWYFLGLQEMLVYFDPWHAGVVLPSFIIVGLMLIPFVDPNPKGNGYFTWVERRFAIFWFCFGFLVLWITLIIQGVFLRGPGWEFFAPWTYWDPHKVTPLTNVDLANFWIFDNMPLKYLPIPEHWIGGKIETLGIVLMGGYFLILPLLYWLVRYRKSELLQQLGAFRYGVCAFFFLTMIALPIKMVLRWTLNIKYIWVTPWINI